MVRLVGGGYSFTNLALISAGTLNQFLASANSGSKTPNYGPPVTFALKNRQYRRFELLLFPLSYFRFRSKAVVQATTFFRKYVAYPPAQNLPAVTLNSCHAMSLN